MSLPPLPPTITRAYDYTGFQAVNPSTPLPANRVEIDYDALFDWTATARAWMASVTSTLIGDAAADAAAAAASATAAAASASAAATSATNAAASAASAASRVPLDGSQAMTGRLTLSADPVNNLHAATKQYVDTAAVGGAAKLNKTGDTMTGDLVIAKASPALSLQKAASGQGAVVVGALNSLVRWMVSLGDATAESGSNAGSNFSISRYTDAGALIDTPLTISRATGAPVFAAADLWRAALGVPWLPDATRWQLLVPGSNVALVLPAGGTWAYFALGYTLAGGTLVGGMFTAGVTAGGSTVGAAGGAGNGYVSLVWRIS